MSADRCPECGKPAVDDLGRDPEFEVDDDEDEEDIPHVLVCIDGHEWLDDVDE